MILRYFIAATATLLLLGACGDDTESNTDTAADTTPSDTGGGDDTTVADTGDGDDTTVADTGGDDDTAMSDTGGDGDTAMSDSAMSDTGGDGDTTNPTTELAVVLSGDQQVPALDSAASGAGTVVVDEVAKTVTVSVTLSNIGTTSAAHIHMGRVGMNGPILFNLANGDFTTISVTLGASDVEDSSVTIDEAIAAVLAGKTYINVHSMAVASGELRGNIGGATLGSAISGGQQVPIGSTNATGGATVTINGAQDAVMVELSTTNLTGITAAHIHMGLPGATGGVLFTLSGSGFSDDLNVTLDASDVEGGGTMAEAVDMLLAGKTYINIHTSAVPAGEIRGQVGTVHLTSTLGGDQAVPSVTTSGSGTGMVTINGAQDTITATLSVSDLGSAVTAAHIHFADVGFNGGVLFPLTNGPFTNPLVVKLTASDLQAVGPISSFAAAVDATIFQFTYFNVHTMNEAGGEVRGQIVR